MSGLSSFYGVKAVEAKRSNTGRVHREGWQNQDEPNFSCGCLTDIKYQVTFESLGQIRSHSIAECMGTRGATNIPVKHNAIYHFPTTLKPLWFDHLHLPFSYAEYFSRDGSSKDISDVSEQEESSSLKSIKWGWKYRSRKRCARHGQRQARDSVFQVFNNTYKWKKDPP